jgi:hypothetical protein
VGVFILIRPKSRAAPSLSEESSDSTSLFGDPERDEKHTSSQAVIAARELVRADC